VDALVERDLAAAPGVLPPANLPLVRHCRGKLHRAYGHAGRDQHRARTEPRCSLLQHPSRLLPQLGRELDRLTALWTRVVPRLFPRPLRVNALVLRLVGPQDGLQPATADPGSTGVPALPAPGHMAASPPVNVPKIAPGRALGDAIIVPAPDGDRFGTTPRPPSN
jgi:hypothetical protein